MQIKPSIFAVYKGDVVVGTGFLVHGGLGVTCSHVVVAADALDGDYVQIRFSEHKDKVNALVIPEYWLDVEKGDVALLRIDTLPDGVRPLPLAASKASRPGTQFSSFGYASAADVKGIIARGSIDGYLPEYNLLQLQAPQADHGISGAPVLDENQNRIVGMITKGHTATGRNAETTFATPVEIIWQLYPQLKQATGRLPGRSPILEGIHLLHDNYDQRIQNFLIEYLGDESDSVPFGGRSKSLQALDTWLAGATPFFLLAAPAGRGKSALLVRWLDGMKSHADLALAFVPVSSRFGTSMEHVFYASLAARLAFLHGDDIPGSPETSTAIYRGLVSDYLAEPLDSGQTLLVVLDGLDEAADWQARADFMPGELPAGVRVVVSARFLAGDVDASSWLRRLNWDRDGLAATADLMPLDQDGVANVLQQMSGPLAELGRSVEIVRELSRLSQGDPLLVRLYVGDLQARHEDLGQMKSEDLARIRPGYEGYFDNWWEDQKKLWGKEKPWREKHVRTVQKILSGALGPFFKADFQALIPELGSDDVTDALEVLQRFIIGDNRTQGYIFSHHKLGQYFWENEFTPIDRTSVEGSFLVWGEQTLQEFIEGRRNPHQKAEIPAYIVRNYGAHLLRANQPVEKWLPLTHHPEWPLAWYALEGTYGGYLRDVEHVWEVCKRLDGIEMERRGKAPYFGEQIRCGLIQASLHGLARNIPAKLVALLKRDRIWTLPQIWVFIKQIPAAEQQSNAVSALLPYLAHDELLECLDAVRSIREEGDRAFALGALAGRLSGDELGPIREAAREIRDPQARANVFSELVKWLPEVSEDALEAANAIEDEEARTSALRVLAKRLSEDRLQKVLQSAYALNDDGNRAIAMSALAERLPEVSGDALEAMRAVQNERNRADVLRTLAEELPEDQLGYILEAARSLESEWNRPDVLSALAKRLPGDQLGEILNMARAISDPSFHYGALTRVLRAMAERLPEDQLGQILEEARAMQPKLYRADVLSAVAVRLPAVGVEALDAARAIKAEQYRARSLETLAERLPEDQLGQVLEVAQAMESEKWREDVLEALAKRLPEDQLGKILESARALQDTNTRVSLFLALVERLPEASGEALAAVHAMQGDDGKASSTLRAMASMMPYSRRRILEMARVIQGNQARAHALTVLAERIPGVTKEALEAARAIQDDQARAVFLETLVPGLSEDQLGDVLEAARAIQSGWMRALALTALVDRLPEVGREALEAASSITDEEKRAEVLSSLAERLPADQLGQVMVAACAIQRERDRAEILSALAKRLPEDQLGHILEAARTIQDEGARRSVLMALAEQVPEGQLGQILEAAYAIQDDQTYGRVLSALAERLPEDQLGQIIEEAGGIQDENERAGILNALMKRLPEDQLGQILQAARAMQVQTHRAEVLSALAERLPEVSGEALGAACSIQDEKSRGEILIALVERLPEDQLGKLLDAARAIENDETRARVMSALMKQLPQIGKEALEAARAIQGAYARAEVLNELAARLPDDQLGEVLEAARAIQDEQTRAGVLSALMVRLPQAGHDGLEAARTIQDEQTRARVLSVLAGRLAEGQLGELLEAARAIQDERSRADVLSASIERLPEDQLGELLEAARAIQDEDARAHVFRVLTPRLLSEPVERLYRLTVDTLPVLAQRARSELLSDVSNLLSILRCLGEESMEWEIFQAVRDVSKWWR